MRLAVVLFNLGGPDSLDAVQPFLFNLFNDPAIIRLPTLARWLLARFIAWRRAPIARAIYDEIGGRSPLLPNTEAQAEALREALAPDVDDTVECFIAMRYWHPLSAATAKAVKAFAPDRIVALPLYPQYSTTTTASSVRAWERAARRVGLSAPVHIVCCYPRLPGFVAALAKRTRAAVEKAGNAGAPRILFSAHGLPKRIVAAGDPYQWQVEQTAAAIVATMDQPDLDWVVCYQSRVGPLEWIGPSTDAEIIRAGADRVPVIVVPLSFVSEHSETLVELDIEYRKLAQQSGVPIYFRIPTADADGGFIAGLADIVHNAVRAGVAIRSGEGDRICPATFGACRCKAT